MNEALMPHVTEMWSKVATFLPSLLSAIVVLGAALGLRAMGFANEIVNLAFGLLLGAIAVAVALAFGLGSREIAAEAVKGWTQSLRRPNKS